MKKWSIAASLFSLLYAKRIFASTVAGINPLDELFRKPQ